MADSGASGEPPRKKARDPMSRLSELRRGIVHYLDAQYGSSEEPTFVMHVIIDGQRFQGIGPSKKRAKVMASAFALVHLGELGASDVEVPAAEIPYADDFTADVFSGPLFYNYVSPEISAVDADLKLPLYRREDYYGPSADFEEDPASMQDAFEGYIGRNATSIMAEIRPDASYNLVSETRTTNPARFVTICRVRGQKYKGEGTSKKLSKARAAAAAMTHIYGIPFKIAEDGVPIYEGSGRAQMWSSYKAELEEKLDPVNSAVDMVNPVEQMNELFPDAEFDFPESAIKPDGFFLARFVIAGMSHEGLGKTKRDAKLNAATNALQELERTGLLQERHEKLESKRKERLEKQKPTEKSNLVVMTQKQARKPKPVMGNALSRLYELHPGLEYQVSGDESFTGSRLRAFIASVTVDGQRFVGIGQSKKLARAEAAEKALKGLGQWTVEDEYNKQSRLHDSKELFPQADVSGRGREVQGRGGYGRGGQLDYSWGGGSGYAQQYGAVEQYNTEGVSEMIGELSQMVSVILEQHPEYGVDDIWSLLQEDQTYRSWHPAVVARQMAEMSSQHYAGAQGYDAWYSQSYSGGPFHNSSGFYWPRGRSRGAANMRRPMGFQGRRGPTRWQ